MTAEPTEVMTLAEATRVLAVTDTPSPSPSAPTTEPLQPQRWTGRVVDLRSAAGVPRCTVVFDIPGEAHERSDASPDVEGLDARIEATTDADGRFRIAAARRVLPKVIVNAAVYDEHRSPVFSGHVMLVDDMTLLVEPAQLLHGRVTDANVLCDGAVGAALLQERKVAGARVAALGTATLQADGSFAVRARVAWPDLPVAIKIGCGDQMFVLHADVASLTSDAGWVGSLGLGRTVVQVTDATGAPLAGATVVAAPPRAAANGSFVRRRTDAAGHASVPIPRSGLELAAAADGFQIDTRFVPGEPCPELVQIRLDRLGAADFFEGSVTTVAGLPVANAVVTALPDATSAAVRVMRPSQARTDDDGRFRIVAGARGVPFAVTAFHKRHGISVEHQVVPNGQHVPIVLPGVRRLRIQAVAPNADSRSRGGDVQWFLVPITGTASHGGSGALPIETEPVAAGDYNLLVFWEDMDLYGQARVTVGSVAADEPDELVVFLEPACWFEGVVRGARRGMSVRHHDPHWLPDVVVAWGTAAPRADGRFRVLAGRRDSGMVELLDEAGVVLARAEARWGATTELAAPGH